MLYKLEDKEKQDWVIVSDMPKETTVCKDDANDAIPEAELRRQMYERIARGHALVESEDQARRKWRGN